MRILVIGGTMFVGRWFVQAAREAGHHVVLFHRGKHGKDLFPDVERVLGDREHDLERLGDQRWDAVVDTSGYLPRVVRKSVEFLKDRTDRYLFVSSISAYANETEPNQTEDAPLAETDDPETEDVGSYYGALKVLCENIVREGFCGRAIIVRPTLIVGPHDPTDRFTFWPIRMRHGGRVIVPERLDQPVQIIDVRDLSEWMLRLLEQGQTGAFNGAGPLEKLTMGGLIEACHLLNTQTELVMIPENFLLAHGVGQWMDLPLWLAAESQSDGMMQVNIDRAIGSGLKFRPLHETLVDTVEWSAAEGVGRPMRAGLSPDKEAEVLAAWDDRNA